MLRYVRYMTQHENSPTISSFHHDAPELYDWILSAARSEADNHYRDRNREILRLTSKVANAPVFHELDNDFVRVLHERVDRAELYARLSCLPHALVVDRLATTITTLRPNDDERQEIQMARHKMESSEDCLHKIVSASAALNTALAQGEKELRWMTQIEHDLSPSLSDPDRPGFVRFRDHIRDTSRSLRSPFVHVSTQLRNIESQALMLKERETAATSSALFGHDEPMVTQCHEYAQQLLGHAVIGELPQMRLALEALENTYEERAKTIRLGARQSVVTSFETGSAEETRWILEHQKPGSTVVSLFNHGRTEPTAVDKGRKG